MTMQMLHSILWIVSQVQEPSRERGQGDDITSQTVMTLVNVITHRLCRLLTLGVCNF